MGMFDTVTFKCPVCGRDLETQSKSGPCILMCCDASKDEVPIDVAGDVIGEQLDCECGKRWRVASPGIRRTVPLHLEPFHEP